MSLAGNRATALALVFSELLQNALEHGAGAVRIELARRDGDVVLAIADEGAGADGAPSGTGLSIVRALVADELQGSFAFTGARAPRWCSRRERAQEVLIVVRRGDEFLVVHRSPENDAYWHRSPAASRRRAFAEAAVRELQEETGLEAAVPSRSAVRDVRDVRTSVRRRGVHRRRRPGEWEPTLDREHDEYRWLPREEAAELLFWPEPARAAAEPAVSELWHVSEDPTIEVFHPHHSELHALDEPLVWAIDTRHCWLYWFPRDCPRACFSATDDTTDEDVERWLDGDRTRRVARHRVRLARALARRRVYAYRLPPETFEPWDKFFISRETVVPIEVVELGDLLARHAEAGNELRIAPSLYPLWDEVIETTLDFSGIRLRNASAAVRILIAEDETIIRLDLRELLERAGFEVCAEAKDGEEAIELARSEQPDLAMLDVKMPKLDGIEAARRILEERPIPIVMLTAYGQEELVSRAVEAGVFGYLVKPFREQDLLPAIAAARARHDELQAVRAEAESLSDALAARKVIERAKGLLMEKEQLSEQEAFARLRKASQASGRPLKVIAEAVVATLAGDA